ncbi:MAG: regulatory protein RecX [Terrimesophilobacter sp.]
MGTLSYLPGVNVPVEHAANVPVEPGTGAVDGRSAPAPGNSGGTPASESPAESDGAELDGAELDGAQREDRIAQEHRTAQEHRAENVSMSALTRRGMSRWELGEKLLARDLDPCIVESELDRLEGVGLIDDEALAETIVRTQRERKGLGRSALGAELRRRRIDQTYIDEALDQLDDEDELVRAQGLADRRAQQLQRLDRQTAERRLSGYLMRKGYTGAVVRTVVDRALPRGSSTVRFR